MLMDICVSSLFSMNSSVALSECTKCHKLYLCVYNLERCAQCPRFCLMCTLDYWRSLVPVVKNHLVCTVGCKGQYAQSAIDRDYHDLLDQFWLLLIKELVSSWFPRTASQLAPTSRLLVGVGLHVRLVSERCSVVHNSLIFYIVHNSVYLTSCIQHILYHPGLQLLQVVEQRFTSTG